MSKTSARHVFTINGGAIAVSNSKTLVELGDFDGLDSGGVPPQGKMSPEAIALLEEMRGELYQTRDLMRYYQKRYNRLAYDLLAVELTPEERERVWMPTVTGKAFQPIEPRAEDLDLESLIHGICLTPRFNGQTRFPYSVGQHTIYVILTVDYSYRKYALVHDFAEGVLGDIISPIKPLFPAYKLMEDRTMAAICELLGLEWPWPIEVVEAVRAADLAVLAAERDQVVTPASREWQNLPTPADVTILEYDWQSVKAELRAWSEVLLGV
jgi:uncharacterized protein